ncbi:biotin/lipoyl-binding protein [Clostridium sp. WB02_MRS01]|uniref:biotin/lipoyl-containing protein n=1 Tax=Clostridium sp. WB02_MRS01 TaxID=2605777 RepID=UPI000E94BAD6|nr:biotin/lipoyl-containing protein [Clostridium sp. WB02_MRS01]MSS08284.1 biotin/lipoyl-binding protein [Clostridium sp. WB02_MRS01]HBG13693.1 acetyl-CoA carboxylase biotin carboxyl carrier protein subunit [Clostridium sp.]
MKNYTITVNGNVYEVTVEEGSATGAPAAANKAVSAPAPAAPKAAPAPAAAPVKAASAGSEGGLKVAAPMPGKILGVKVSSGQAVKRGDVLILLEAMKMENEIVAPSDGTVASVNVAIGDSVEAGATLATLN